MEREGFGITEFGVGGFIVERGQKSGIDIIKHHTCGKVTTSQLDTTNESQEVSLFPAGDHKASKTDVHERITKQDRNNINNPHPSYPATIFCL